VSADGTVAAVAVPAGGAEWLEADGLGGFASGTVDGIRTRRYHALLLVAPPSPAHRVVLVNDIEAWIETPRARYALSTHRYAPEVLYPDGQRRIRGFAIDPWPRWRFVLENGTEIEHEVFAAHGLPAVVLTWRRRGGTMPARLLVRPLVSGRDMHALHHENPAYRFDAHVGGPRVAWRPYPTLPSIAAYSNARYRHEPDWYRSFLYSEERARGLDFVEDLASPGVFTWDLEADRDAVLVLTADFGGDPAPALAALRDAARESASPPSALLAVVDQIRDAEGARRSRFSTRLEQSADAYRVRRDGATSIIAGYPWFGDWGRDTFIALRGLCLATGHLDDAAEILLEWSEWVNGGMLPNRFLERGDVPEYNSVDAALWFVIAAHETLAALARERGGVAPRVQRRLREAVEAILDGYARGTRYGIRLDADGLLAAGEPGIQLTWMDSKVGDWVVTPRIGKPVEVQALWLNALRGASVLEPRYGEVFDRGVRAFRDRFWNEERGALHDVVDVDHRPGTVDPSLRPNQLLAVGGLPVALIEGERARRIVDTVERALWTPLGPRTLAREERAYRGRYEGGVWERDIAYHQGTAWPWLAGPFVEAWVRVRGGGPDVVREARERFVSPLLRHLNEAGLGHVSEIADGDPPHTPRGCPFQAWSVGELLRLERSVLAAESPTVGRHGSVPASSATDP
jgi:predicted glycogen debranching enzyme